MKRLALCIGNQDYQYLPKLSCAIADAEAMKEALDKLGFETALNLNLNNEDFTRFIYSFEENYSEYDAILIYYAGHGFQIDNDNILAPIDINLNDGKKAARHLSFSIDDLLKALGDNPKQTKIVIIDACREIFDGRGVNVRSFGAIYAPSGSLLAFATSPGHSSKENIKCGHGYYTEALLKHISAPRTDIETVFKRVREELSVTTNGSQIPWEHTSLIGSFYLNPKTVYDGVHYANDALCDRNFTFSPESQIRNVVEELKTRDWQRQGAAIAQISSLDMHDVNIDELFVLGRNIYQAAEGNSFKCLDFINGLAMNVRIPEEAKIHLLNGMAYEIYFDSNGNVRKIMKARNSYQILSLLERPAFYSSKTFINSVLDDIQDRILYRPGQTDQMFFRVITEKQYFFFADETEGKEYLLKEVFYKGKVVYHGEYDIDLLPFYVGYSKKMFESYLAKILVAPRDRIMVQYDEEMNDDSIIAIDKSMTSLNYKAT